MARVLDRVLGGDDLLVRPVEDVQRRVERRGLAGAGRARNQEDAVGTADDLVELVERVGLEAEVHQADLDGVGPENTQHDRLAVIGRAAADAEVDLLPVHRHLDAAVLGDSTLGNVDARHELESGQQRRLHALGQVVTHVTDTVDPVAEQDPVLHRLDVDVRCAVADGLRDDAVHQADDRRVVAGGDVHRRVERDVHRLGHERLVAE
jgi:hypothetical protein